MQLQPGARGDNSTFHYPWFSKTTTACQPSKPADSATPSGSEMPKSSIFGSMKEGWSRPARTTRSASTTGRSNLLTMPTSPTSRDTLNSTDRRQLPFLRASPSSTTGRLLTLRPARGRRLTTSSIALSQSVAYLDPSDMDSLLRREGLNSPPWLRNYLSTATFVNSLLNTPELSSNTTEDLTLYSESPLQPLRSRQRVLCFIHGRSNCDFCSTEILIPEEFSGFGTPPGTPESLGSPGFSSGHSQERSASSPTEDMTESSTLGIESESSSLTLQEMWSQTTEENHQTESPTPPWSISRTGSPGPASQEPQSSSEQSLMSCASQTSAPTSPSSLWTDGKEEFMR